MATKRLNQVLAIVKGVKTRVYADFTALHHTTAKADLYEGFTKTYRPKDEAGEVHPPQTKRVQITATDAFAQANKLLSELFDVTAATDWANTNAKADVIVDGAVLLKDVPSTYLMFLDKQLGDLHKFVSSLVELDPSVEWQLDASSNMWKSPIAVTQRTEKVQKPIVRYEATPQHPAQTDLITVDVTVGYWDTVRFSGAIPRVEKQKILDRTQKLIHAVKEALEQANLTEAPDQRVGSTVLGYLFAT